MLWVVAVSVEVSEAVWSVAVLSLVLWVVAVSVEVWSVVLWVVAVSVEASAEVWVVEVSPVL